MPGEKAQVSIQQGEINSKKTATRTQHNYASVTMLPRSTAMDGERGSRGAGGPGGRYIESCPPKRRFLRGDDDFSDLTSYHSRRGAGRLRGSPGTLRCSTKRSVCTQSSSSGMKFGTRGAYRDTNGQGMDKYTVVYDTYRGDFPLNPVPINRLHPCVATKFPIDEGAVFALRDFCCTEAMWEVVVQHAEEKLLQALVEFHAGRERKSSVLVHVVQLLRAVTWERLQMGCQ